MRSEFRGLLFGLTVGLILGLLGGMALNEKQFESKCHAKLMYLTDMPKGGLYMDKDLDMIWSKTENTVLAFVRIPNPERAQLVRLWGSQQQDSGKPAQTQTQASSTTSTTIMAEGAKR